MGQRLADVGAPWDAAAEGVPLGLCNYVVTPHGVLPAGDPSLEAECPMSYELLRSSAM